MSMPKTNTFRQNEQGFASLVIAFILIIVLGLLTIGFAKLARREQQSALDKQLATQAYYAAETGVNDAISDIKNNYISSTATPNSATKCIQPSDLKNSNAKTYHPVINQANGVLYSCLLVNLAPQTLVYGGVQPGAERNVLFTPKMQTAGYISITVDWHTASTVNPNNAFPTTYSGFLNAPSWSNNKYVGVLQLGLTYLGSGTGLTRSQLINDTYTSYLYPSKVNDCPVGNTNNSCDFSQRLVTKQGPILKGGCVSGLPTTCSVTIINIPYNPGDSYLLHFLDFYDPSDITIRGQGPIGAIAFTNAQNQIDVTGRARNVLKRIQVRISPTPPTTAPDSIQVQNICKRQETAPLNTIDPTVNPNGTNFISPTSGAIVNSIPGDPCNLDSP